MTAFASAFVTSLVLGVGLTLVVRNRALAWGLVDAVNTRRKMHVKPVPRLGGVGIVGAFFVSLLVLSRLGDRGLGSAFEAERTSILGLVGCGTGIALLGLYDDLRGADARVKFSVQIAFAAVLFYAGFQVRQLALPIAGEIDLGVLALPITILWIVGLTNSLNLIDGLDGLAGGVALIVTISQFGLALMTGNVALAALMVTLAGALLAFLLFNRNPATIFMGDTGSMFLGFVLGAVSIKTAVVRDGAVNLLIPALALGFPIADTLFAMTRRSLKGRPMFSADKEHIHHRLVLYLGLTQANAVVVLYGLSALLAGAALTMHWADDRQAVLLLGIVAALWLAFMQRLGMLAFGRLRAMGAVRRRNAVLKQVVRRVCGDLRQAVSNKEVWLAVRPLAEELEASRFELALTGSSARFVVSPLAISKGKPRSRVPLKYSRALSCGGKTQARLNVEWADGREQVDRDLEIAIEAVADAAAKALAQGRIRRASAKVRSTRRLARKARNALLPSGEWRAGGVGVTGREP